jgi:6-phosphogluconolactonase
MPTVIETLADPQAVCLAAAEALAQQAAQTIEAWGRFALVLSGGSTPRRLYQILAQEPYRSGIEWNKIHFFWGDERCVPPDHADSNFALAWRELLEGLKLPAANLHRMRAEEADLHLAACDYQKEIATAFDSWPFAAPPSFDLVFLGMGPDGHTASLFPHTQALAPTTHWVVANHVPKLNANRLTMTPTLLNRAKAVYFLAAGADKASVLKEVLEGPADPQRLPSQLIAPESGNLVWLVDEAAATQLGR